MFGEGNRGGEGEAEGAVVGDRGDGSARVGSGKAALAREFHKAVVARNEVVEGKLVGVANDGNEHAIVCFDGKSDIHRRRVHDAFAYKASCGRAVLAEGNGESAKCIERGAGFGGMRFAMGEELVELDGNADCGERARPAADHGVGHGFPHR